MFEIVKNRIVASAFVNEEHLKFNIQVILNDPNKPVFDGKFKITKFKNDHYVEVFDPSDVFLGYLKIDNIKNIAKNITIDGTCETKQEEPKSDQPILKNEVATKSE